MKSKFAFTLPLLVPSDYYTLVNGVHVPVIGFGTWRLNEGEETYNAVLAALKSGYVHIDTAALYGNEKSVGKAVKDSGVDRKTIFITTKIWNDVITYEDAKIAIDKSLNRLGMEYVDLLLIHWPNPASIRGKIDYNKRNRDVYRAMEEAYRAGRAKAIGVSNFHPHHLKELMETASVIPHVNQIYCSPSDLQEEIVAYNDSFDILTVAYSPLAAGKLFESETLKAIADKYNKTVSQIVLRYLLHKGVAPLPRSKNAERIKENIDVFDFLLTDQHINIIDDLHGKYGLAPDPDLSKH